MNTRILIVMLLIGASCQALAENEVLSVRVNSAGEYEAVVTGELFDECGFRINEPERILIAGFRIEVGSDELPLPPCIIPLDPPATYEVTAPLGHLPPGEYRLGWAQSWGDEIFFNEIIEFSVAGSPAREVPLTSPAGWVVLVVLLLLVAVLRQR